MGLIDKILSLFGGGGSQSSEPSRESTSDEGAETVAEEEAAEPEAEAEEPEAEEEAEAEAEGEDEGPEDVPTKDVAAMADPRRRDGEENTVHNRAENPADHGEAEEKADADEDEAEGDEEEGGGDVPTKSVAEMADPRRREGEENTVHNRAENPADHGEADAEEEAAAEGDEEEEDGGGDVPTKDVAAMADPRRRDGEENTVANRAENPDDQRAT